MKYIRQLLTTQLFTDEDMVLMITTGWSGGGGRKTGKVASFIDLKTATNLICYVGDFPVGLEDATGKYLQICRY